MYVVRSLGYGAGILPQLFLYGREPFEELARYTVEGGARPTTTPCRTYIRDVRSRTWERICNPAWLYTDKH